MGDDKNWEQLDADLQVDWMCTEEEANCLICSSLAGLERRGDKCIFIFYVFWSLPVNSRVALRYVIFQCDHSCTLLILLQFEFIICTAASSPGIFITRFIGNHPAL